MKGTLWATFAMALLPFIYHLSLAMMLSAYVHGCGFPSRSLLRAYIAPSNAMFNGVDKAGIPVVRPLMSNYFHFCVRITQADYDPNKSGQKGL